MEVPEPTGDRLFVVSEDDRRGSLWVVSIICCAYILLLMVLRATARRSTWGADDYLATAATVSQTTIRSSTCANDCKVHRHRAFCLHFSSHNEPSWKTSVRPQRLPGGPHRHGRYFCASWPNANTLHCTSNMTDTGSTFLGVPDKRCIHVLDVVSDEMCRCRSLSTPVFDQYETASHHLRRDNSLHHALVPRIRARCASILQQVAQNRVRGQSLLEHGKYTQ